MKLKIFKYKKVKSTNDIAIRKIRSGIKNGIVQPDGSIKKEPTFNPEHVADAVLHLVRLPLDTNILNMTIMASNMPFIGRG